MISGIMGIPLGLGGGKVKSQVFTASGNWTKPTDVEVVWAFLVGGGGSGGNYGQYGAGLGTGGGGGECVFGMVHVLNLSSPISVTIGAGGAAKIGQLNGSAGGNTSFASLTALGGDYGRFFATNYGVSGCSKGGGNKKVCYPPLESGAYNFAFPDVSETNGKEVYWGGTSSAYKKTGHGLTVTSPILTSFGGGSGGGGYGDGSSLAYAQVGGDSFFASGGGGYNLFGSGGGASYGPGGVGGNTGVNAGSGAANSGAGGGGHNSGSYYSGAGGSGYAVIYWVE